MTLAIGIRRRRVAEESLQCLVAQDARRLRGAWPFPEYVGELLTGKTDPTANHGVKQP